MINKIRRAAELIHHADAFLITAGAGIGVDSGLPDFRGNAGFWRAYPQLQKDGISFVQAATAQNFKSYPQQAWAFYGHRFNLYQQTQPHAGFDLLRKWTETKSIDSFVFTSNVDGHFQKSGFPSTNIYECHGAIRTLQCADSCCQKLWKFKRVNFDIEKMFARGQLPQCPYCGGVARPNILMFDDYDWIDRYARFQRNRFDAWLDAIQDNNIVIIEIGAGKAIPTVRNTSERINGNLIRINPVDASGYGNTISIKLGALDAIEQIESAINSLALVR